MNPVEFGSYIRGLRKERNMTIRQLELYSGVSNAYLSHIENGKRGIPSPDVLKKIHKPLGVSYEELMERAGYIEFGSGAYWERLALFIHKYSSIETYRDALMAFFELIEFYTNHNKIEQEHVDILNEEMKKVGVDVDSELLLKNPPLGFEKLEKTLKEVMDKDRDFSVAEFAVNEEKRTQAFVDTLDPRIKFFKELQDELGVDFTNRENIESLKRAAKILFVRK